MIQKQNKVEIYSEEIGCYYYVSQEQWDKWEKDDTIFLNRFSTFSTFSTISSLSRKSSIFLLVLTMSSRGVKASNIKQINNTDAHKQGIVKIHKNNYDCLHISKDGATYNFNEEGVLVKTKHAYKLDAQRLGQIRHKLGYSKNYFSNKVLINNIVKYVIKDAEKPRNFVFIKALPPNLLNDEVG